MLRYRWSAEKGLKDYGAHGLDAVRRLLCGPAKKAGPSPQAVHGGVSKSKKGRLYAGPPNSNKLRGFSVLRLTIAKSPDGARAKGHEEQCTRDHRCRLGNRSKRGCVKGRAVLENHGTTEIRQ